VPRHNLDYARYCRQSGSCTPVRCSIWCGCRYCSCSTVAAPRDFAGLGVSWIASIDLQGSGESLGAAPETILCVTYTKAAAAEMQRRLYQQLGDWSVLQIIAR